MSIFPQWANKLSEGISGKDLDAHANTLKAALPGPVNSAMTDSKVTSALGAAPEVGGRTITGGRRHRKTRGGKRGVKKTRRGGKRHH
jgi:hypothetical protein